jgi:hypothetical protein
VIIASMLATFECLSGQGSAKSCSTSESVRTPRFMCLPEKLMSPSAGFLEITSFLAAQRMATVPAERTLFTVFAIRPFPVGLSGGACREISAS